MEYTYQSILSNYLASHKDYQLKNNHCCLKAECCFRNGEIWINFPWTIVWVNTKEKDIKSLENRLLEDFKNYYDKVFLYTTMCSPIII